MTNLHRELTLHNVEGLANDQDIVTERLADGRYHIEITTTSEAVAMSLEVLRLVSAVASRVYTAIDRAHTQHEAQKKVDELRAKEKAVAEQYWIYREQGMAHRVAVDCVHQISDVCRQMNWTKTDIGYCVRSFPKQYFEEKGLVAVHSRQELLHGDR